MSHGTRISEAQAAAIAEQIVDLGHRAGLIRHQLVGRLVDYDNSGCWALSGSVTCAHWAADRLRITVGTAREYLRVGRALRVLTVVDAAFASGGLSWAQVRRLTTVAVDHPEAQDELVQLAQSVPAGQLGVELARWTGRHEDEDERDDRHQRSAGLFASVDPDGMHVIVIRLPPLAGAAVLAAVDQHLARHRTARQEGADGSGQGAGDAEGQALSEELDSETDQAPKRRHERPSLSRQRAAALVDLVNGGGGTSVTEIVLHVRADGCTLDDGSPIEGTVLERIAPHSFLRVLIHDAERRPINASGRHRHPFARQKRVVKERDRHCTEPGCRSQMFLEFDHDPDFEVSRRTIVDELQLKCGKHHRDRHRPDAAGS